MTFCTRERVSQLIAYARFSPEIGQQERARFDEELMELHATAANIGDVLISLGLDRTVPFRIRLSSLLALDPLVNLEDWKKGNRFSDKNAVSCNLVQYFQNRSIITDEPPLQRVLFQVFSKVLCYEFCEASPWQELITEFAKKALSHESLSMELMLALSVVAKSSAPLWLFLAKDILLMFSETIRSSNRLQADALQFVVNLRKNRCPHAEEAKFRLKEQCLLLQEEMSDFAVGILQQKVNDASLFCLDATAERVQYLSECHHALQLCTFFIQNEELALKIFTTAHFFLINIQPYYLSEMVAPTTEVMKVANSSLSAIQEVLTAFPSLSYPCISETMNAVMWYMVKHCDECNNDRESNLLADLMMENEALPLGCGAYDVPSLAGSILELYLEMKPDASGLVLNHIWSLVPEVEQKTNQETAVLFFATAMYHISRGYLFHTQCAAEDSTVAENFFPAIFSMSLTVRSTNEYLWSMLLKGVSQCFFYCKEPTVAGLAFQGLDALYNYQSNFPSGTGEPLIPITMHAIGCLLENISCTSIEFARQMVQEHWFFRAVTGVSTASSQISLFGFGFTLNVILTLQPLAKVMMWEQEALLARVIDNFFLYSTIRPIALLLGSLLQRFLEHSEPSSGGADSAACATVLGSIRLIFSRCENFQALSSSLVMRQLSVCFLAVLTALSSVPILCRSCIFAAVKEGMMLLCQFGVEMGPFDEGTSRSFAAFFGTAAVICKDVLEAPFLEIMFQSSSAILFGSVGEQHSCSTISALGSAQALIVMQQPSLLDSEELLCSVLQKLFMGNVLSHRKGVNYLGAVLFFSAAVIRAPSKASAALLKGDTAGEGNWEGWGAGLGWSCTLAPFAEESTWGFIMAAWLFILQNLVGAGCSPEHLSILGRNRLSHIRVYKFPSVISKKPSKAVEGGVSAIEAITAGLIMVRNGVRPAPVSGFRKELLGSVEVQEVISRVVAEPPPSTSLISWLPALLKQPKAEAAHRLLEILNQLGFGEQVMSMEYCFGS